MVNRGMLTEVSCPRYDDRGTEPWKADCGGRGFIPRPTELTIIVRFCYSFCRGRSHSTYPGWTWSGTPNYPGIAMPEYRSQRFSLSSSVCYGMQKMAKYLYGVSPIPTYDLRSKWLQESTDRMWLRLSCRSHSTRPGPAGDARCGWLVPRYSV